MDPQDELEALMASLPALKQRFERAGLTYRALSATAAARVRSEQWSRAPIHSPFPLGIERERREAPGKPMKAAPGRLAGHLCSGLDAEGKVVFVYDYVADDGRRYEEFWEHHPDGVNTVLFDHYEPADNVINVQAVRLADGRPAQFLRYARAGIYLEIYRYDGVRLQRIYGAAREHDAPGSLIFTTDDLHYAADGQLERIVRRWEGGVVEQIYPSRRR